VADLGSTRILVTGATGFVGANVVRDLLGHGAEVDVLVREGSDPWRLEGLAVQPHAGDVADRRGMESVLRHVRPDFVVNLAATSGHHGRPEDREAALRSSVLGTHAVLAAAAEAGVGRVVHAASSMEYGGGEGPLSEETPLAPQTFRGVAKAGATMVCRAYARARWVDVVSLRLFHVYGPWEGAHRLVPSAILSALDGRQLPLTKRGIARDPVFVTDVAEAFRLALHAERAGGQEVNIGSGTECANEEIVGLIEQIVGRPLDVLEGAFPQRPSDRQRRVADIGKAHRLLRWKPRTPLRRGLEETVAWFREHLDRFPVMAGARR
jgi:nucleoside-diphosphate-sugar epimerase